MISVPAIVTVPLVGLSSPASVCISVDLPEPDGPITATSCAALDVERDPAQRIDGRRAVPIAARQISCRDDDVATPRIHLLVSLAENATPARCGRLIGMERAPGAPPVATLARVSSLATAPESAAPGDPRATQSAPVRTRRVTPDLVFGLGLGAGLCAVVFVATGGSDLGPNTWTQIALLLIGAVLAGLVLLRGRAGPRWGGVTFALFAAIAALTAISIAWSVQPDDSWLEANRTLSYAAAFGGAIALARLLPERWPAVVGSIAMLATVVSAYALLVKVFPATFDPQETLGRADCAARLLERDRPDRRARPAGVSVGRRSHRPWASTARAVGARVRAVPDRRRPVVLAQRAAGSARRRRLLVRIRAAAPARRADRRGRPRRSRTADGLGAAHAPADTRQGRACLPYERRTHVRRRPAAGRTGAVRRGRRGRVRARPRRARRPGTPASRDMARRTRRDRPRRGRPRTAGVILARPDRRDLAPVEHRDEPDGDRRRQARPARRARQLPRARLERGPEDRRPRAAEGRRGARLRDGPPSLPRLLPRRSTRTATRSRRSRTSG